MAALTGGGGKGGRGQCFKSPSAMCVVEVLHYIRKESFYTTAEQLVEPLKESRMCSVQLCFLWRQEGNTLIA